LSAEARLLQVLKRLWELPLDIRISGQPPAQIEPARLCPSRKSAAALAIRPRADRLDLIPQIGDGPEPRSSAHRAAAGALPHHRARGAPRQQRAVLFRQRRYGFNNSSSSIISARCLSI